MKSWVLSFARALAGQTYIKIGKKRGVKRGEKWGEVREKGAGVSIEGRSLAIE